MNISRETLQELAKGQLKWVKCPCCDNSGYEYWDGYSGLGAGPSPPNGIPEDQIASGLCENCEGIGFIII